MLFPPQPFTLKDGRKALLRSPQPEDAADSLRVGRLIALQSPFLLMAPEEYVDTVEEEARYLRQIVDSPYHLMIMAFVEGEYVGHCVLSLNRLWRIRHRASLGIGIRQEYWRLGIGRALIQSVETAALGEGVEIMELEYIEGNERGAALYEKLGYREYGRRARAVRYPDGSERMEILMRKEIGHDLTRSD